MDGPGLAAVRTEDECVKAPLPEMEQIQMLGAWERSSQVSCLQFSNFGKIF